MEAGDRIGSYEIIAPIDAGGMGVVYKALHTGIDREVAIKVLLPNLMLSQKIRDRFKQEAYVQAKLIHPNIVQVSDSIHTEKHSAIVMEYVDGGSLANKLDEKPGAWSEADFRAVFGPIVEGVAYAHGRGVVHRDIKPENVLLTTDGTPKVADFGIAKILAGDSHMTRTGAKLGTVPYMAPEQYDGKTDLGTEADVYALGMLAWRMLTGDLPVDGDSAKAVYEHYTGARALPSIAAEVEGLSPALARLIDGCLQVDPQQRPKDAGVMQKLLGAKEAPSAPPLPEDNPEIGITSGSVELEATTAPNAPVEEMAEVVPDTVTDLEVFLTEMGIETEIATPIPENEGRGLSALTVFALVVGLFALLLVGAYFFQDKKDDPHVRAEENTMDQEKLQPRKEMSAEVVLKTEAVAHEKLQPREEISAKAVLKIEADAHEEELVPHHTAVRYLEEAKIAMSKRQWYEAIELYRIVLEKQPDHTDANLNLERAKLELRREKMIEQIDDLVAKKDYLEAWELVERFGNAIPRESIYHVELVRRRLVVGELAGPVVLEKAKNALKREDFAVALQLSEQVLDMQPGNAEALLLRKDILQKQALSAPVKANDVPGRVIAEKDPTSTKKLTGKERFKLAEKLYQEGRKAQLGGRNALAITKHKEALRAHSRYYKAHKQLGILYAARADSVKAIRHYKSYIKGNPNAGDRKTVENAILRLGGTL